MGWGGVVRGRQSRARSMGRALVVVGVGWGEPLPLASLCLPLSPGLCEDDALMVTESSVCWWCSSVVVWWWVCAPACLGLGVGRGREASCSTCPLWLRCPLQGVLCFPWIDADGQGSAC